MTSWPEGPDRNTRRGKRSRPGSTAEVISTTPVPRWVAPVFIVLSVCLLPWIGWLAVSLPTRTQAHHWRLAWVGLDLAEASSLALTAWFATRRSTWIPITATTTATLLVIDAWFDCTTAAPGWPFVASLSLALAVELPLAALSLWIARHAERTDGPTESGPR
ncbi:MULTISPECIES: hypothetical protein [unclassified Pseudonocardia]|uniref:hypothetical protein n=1 Tax=unclassified Pseudonocardia TaxID=2619320 RepID=UPI0025D48790|nr:MULTISPECIES: hypothetical protein [unclassified Pseudonocardia]